MKKVFEIVGREEELASLKAFVGEVNGGFAGLVLEGEAGIGKSTLWEAGVGYARSQGVRVIAALSGATLYAVGETWGGFAHQASAGHSDAFLQEMDAASGVRVWTYQFGTRRTDSGLAAWSDGTAIYVGGITEGTFQGATRGGGGDAFVSRVDLP